MFLMLSSLLKIVEPYYQPWERWEYDVIDEVDSFKIEWDELINLYKELNKQISIVLNNKNKVTLDPRVDMSKIWKIPKCYNWEYPNANQIQEEHHYRFNMIKEIIKEHCNNHIHIEDWWIKLISKSLEKINNMWYCPDITRLRIIYPDLDSLLRSHDTIRNLLSNKLELIQSNNYYRWYKSRYDSYRKSINTARYWLEQDRDLRDISTEIQFVTKRMMVAWWINYPFDVSKLVKYPSEEHKKTLETFMIKTTVLDLSEILKDINN